MHHGRFGRGGGQRSSEGRRKFGSRFGNRGFQRGRGFMRGPMPMPESPGFGMFRGPRPPYTEYPGPNNNPRFPQMAPGPEPLRNSNNVLWAEARTQNGKPYFYHTITRETSWERPKGPNVTIISHDEWCSKGENENENKPMEILGTVRSPGVDEIDGTHQGPTIKSSVHMSPGADPVGPPSQWHRSPKRQMGQPNSPGPPQTGKMPSSPNPTGLAQVRRRNYIPDNAVPKFHPPGQFQPPCPDFLPPENKFNLAPDLAKVGADPPIVNMPNPMSQFPGCSPFVPMGLMPPQFGMPPPFSPQFAFPPPWTNMAGPTPTGVPPPDIVTNHVVAQIDPKLLAQANEWIEYKTLDGRSYFFNARNQISVWEKPQILKEFDAAKEIIQQRGNTQPTVVPMKDTADKMESSKQSTKLKEKEMVEDVKKKKAGEMCKPTSCTPISGTPWCIVLTGDKRIFFFNPSTRKSLWERPLELIGRYDIDELMQNIAEGKSSKVKKAEATSTTGPVSESSKIKIAPIKIKLEKKDKSNEEFEQEVPERSAKKMKISAQGANTMEFDDIPEEMPLLDLTKDDASSNEDHVAKTEVEKIRIETKDALKEANALEAEVRAARERATTPIESRLKQFREMLVEKNVSAYSAWEKELHKIVFDPRYLLLASKERKVAFDNYVRDRAENEKIETVTKIKRVKELFMIFLGESNVTQRMTYSEFSHKYGRHEMYKVVENSRERETYFCEYISDLKRKEKNEKAQKKEKVKSEFIEALKTEIKDYHLEWCDVKKKVGNDSKYDIIDEEEREKLFKKFQEELKWKTKTLEKKKEIDAKEKEHKETEKPEPKELEKEKVGKGSDIPNASDKDVKAVITKKEEKQEVDKEKMESPKKEDKQEVEKLEEKIKSPKEEDKQQVEKLKEKIKSPKKVGDKNLGNVEDVSEEEEGCLFGESEDEIRLKRERKERAEVSMRKREKEVQETLATHFKDREKKRKYHRHDNAVQEFQALLNDLVRNADASWTYFKKDVRKDRRWKDFDLLSKYEMKELFVKHCDALFHKKERRFRELLHDSGVKLTSSWTDVRKNIKNDHRYRKFSNSEQKCKREFELYLNDMRFAVKSDFWELLKESKMLTYKTRQEVRENSNVFKDIESLLANDKRYLEMDNMPEERRQLLTEFLDDAERRGPPPPPTASNLRKRRSETNK